MPRSFNKYVQEIFSQQGKINSRIISSGKVFRGTRISQSSGRFEAQPTLTGDALDNSTQVPILGSNSSRKVTSNA